MSKPRDYDTTIARIAGNIASGLASKPDLNASGFNGGDGIRDWAQSVTLISVALARAIVAEVKRTEPAADDRER